MKRVNNHDIDSSLPFILDDGQDCNLMIKNQVEKIAFRNGIIGGGNACISIRSYENAYIPIIIQNFETFMI